MPLLLVFALVAACLPVPWEPPPFDPPREMALALCGGAVGCVLLAAFGLRTWVVRTLRRDPGRRNGVERAYGRARRALFYVNVATAATCIIGFGWGWLVSAELKVDWAAKPKLAPFAELAVLVPYFAILVGNWLIHYDAERALYRALPGTGRAFSPRHSYLLRNARQFALMVMLPVGMVVTQQTVGRFAPKLIESDGYLAAELAVMPCMLVFLPLALKPLLGLTAMPPGPLRTRLEALAARLDFRCADFLLWHTHGSAANAMIAGVMPRVRYVVFTDRLLDDLPPDELGAVLGHEIGHAKHGHVVLYAAFLALSISVLGGLMLLVERAVEPAAPPDRPETAERVDDDRTWLVLPPVVLVAGYLFVVFGALSRRCERQADVFGCKAVSCGDPACTGHDERTIFPPGGNGLCPTGIRTFARALARVGDLNGVAAGLPERPSVGRLVRTAWAWVRAWQHSPMPHRIAFVMGLIDRPGDEPRFQRRLFAFKCALMAALAVAFAALISAVGWAEFRKVL
jgi:Zn-dependent protease with chaperone function